MKPRLATRLIAICFLMFACAKKPETAPAPANASATGDRARCIAVRERLAQYPDLIVDEQPTRLSGTFPKISPARRDTAFTVGFTVNMAGKPVMATFSVSDHVGPRFATELKLKVASWRYAPATLEGCAVARKVSHTVDTRGRPKTGSALTPAMLHTPHSALRTR